jgi:predicted nucleotidyltransferase
MIGTSLNLSSIEELHDLATVVRTFGIAAAGVSHGWLLIGAAARDLLLHHACGLPLERMTADVDLAVAVAGWPAFEQIETGLLAQGYTSDSARQRFRLESMIVDVVPFGGVATNHEIGWPPAGNPVMKVLGLEDVLRSCVPVELPGDVTVRAASLEGLAILKCLAWEDRHTERRHHDAVDLRQLILAYKENWNLESLYEEGLCWVERFDFRIEEAGAAFLGAKMRGIVTEPTASAVQEILERETTNDRLAFDMKGEPDENLRLIEALLEGFRGA